MKAFHLITFTLVSCFSFFISFHEASSAASAKKDLLDTYIVFLDKPESLASAQPDDLHRWYTTFLPKTHSNSAAQERMVHSYRNVITGFSAKLTPDEAKAMERKEGILSARVERSMSPLTTHSPEFLGLQQSSGLWKSTHLGEGVIIGVIDTGIKHDHPSFNDQGMPPPPARWRGSCQFDGKKICNNKLIGAKNFVFPHDIPSDQGLHGTHTAAEAAGIAVEGANLFGQAKGTSMGIAPFAHLAMYKVCEKTLCFESSVLAAMDAAIEDGVDVLSLSLKLPGQHLYDDAIALGAFRAIQRGIFVSCSAGNGGPRFYPVVNTAPWILTVGASTIDREIRAAVTLGNNQKLHGQSAFQPGDLQPKALPIMDPIGSANSSAAFCRKGSLKNMDVKGKIVLCQVGGSVSGRDKGQEVKDNGGLGMILINALDQGHITEAIAHVLPASNINYEDGIALRDYLKSASSPTAAITFEGTLIREIAAPQVAGFSSRGPSLQTPGILKPDVIGPGVSILAAWAISVDNVSLFNMVSGTSMSCPHLSGVAALIKEAHPDWSPAAIKSSILTTATTVDRGGKPISNERNSPATVFEMGAGHVNPPKALNPGLVYDIQPDDYIAYICGLGYNDTQVRRIVQRNNVNCSNESSIPGAQLNYPTFLISLGRSPQTYTRTVTNVGMPNSTYTSTVFPPDGVNVEVTPSEINLKEIKDKATYSITFSRVGKARFNTVGQGSLVWSSADQRYQVVSTIAVVSSDEFIRPSLLLVVSTITFSLYLAC